MFVGWIRLELVFLYTKRIWMWKKPARTTPSIWKVEALVEVWSLLIWRGNLNQCAVVAHKRAAYSYFDNAV